MFLDLILHLGGCTNFIYIPSYFPFDNPVEFLKHMWLEDVSEGPDQRKYEKCFNPNIFVIYRIQKSRFTVCKRSHWFFLGFIKGLDPIIPIF